MGGRGRRDLARIRSERSCPRRRGLHDVVTRWHFFREPDFRGGHSWRWIRQTGPTKLKSRTSFFTFWECVKDAAQAGFDQNALDGPPVSDSFIVELER